MAEQINTERLKDAYAILAGIPAERYAKDLKFIANRVKPGCNTLACGFGWLAMHPAFPEVHLQSYDHDIEVRLNGRLASYDDGAEKVFGLSYESARDIFGTKTASDYDVEAQAGDLTDKELLLYRIRRKLGQKASVAAQAAKADA